jgi:hypothetical protein
MPIPYGTHVVEAVLNVIYEYEVKQSDINKYYFNLWMLSID